MGMPPPTDDPKHPRMRLLAMAQEAASYMVEITVQVRECDEEAAILRLRIDLLESYLAGLGKLDHFRETIGERPRQAPP